MATVTVSIPNPVVTGTDHFIVKYRLVGASAWTLVGNKTNTPFTISGLADGNYEIQYQLVTGSPAVISDCITQDCFTVVTGCNCPTLSNPAWHSSGPSGAYMSLDIDFASSGIPPCGMSFEIYDQYGNYISVSPMIIGGNTFPLTSPAGTTFQWQYLWFVPGITATIKAYAECCNTPDGTANRILCGQFMITQGHASPAACISSIIVLSNRPFAFFDPSVNKWYLNIQVIDSVPSCENVTVHYQEVYVKTGSPDSATVTVNVGSLPIVSGTKTIRLEVTPNNTDYGNYLYTGYVVDCCSATQHPF
jgi:hypothetical protein